MHSLSSTSNSPRIHVSRIILAPLFSRPLHWGPLNSPHLTSLSLHTCVCEGFHHSESASSNHPLYKFTFTIFLAFHYQSLTTAKLTLSDCTAIEESISTGLPHQILDPKALVMDGIHDPILLFLHLAGLPT